MPVRQNSHLAWAVAQRVHILIKTAPAREGYKLAAIFATFPGTCNPIRARRVCRIAQRGLWQSTNKK
jgi:hypothetical protein